MKNNIVIYQGKNGEIKLDADLKDETIWATQQQIADLFETTRENIVQHVGNIYKDGELLEGATCKKILQVQTEGNRKVNRKVNFYNLDAIISVGYRVNSKRATDFRIWATKVLKTHIIKGYTINKERLDQLNQMLEIVSRSEIAEVAGVADIVQNYLGALDLLEAYDEDNLTLPEGKKPKWELTYVEAIEFLKKLPFYEISTNFGRERSDSFRGIVAGLYQTFGGVDLYSSTEEKAANLLYQVVKDHPFFDGNKRSAAALFIYFLSKNGNWRVDGSTLAAMTLMVALSRPAEKDTMVKMVMNLLELNSKEAK